MPFKEALFWFGITLFGVGLTLWVGKDSSRAPAIILMISGLASISYSIYTHHRPNIHKIPFWIVLLLVTCIGIGYDYYDRHSGRDTLPWTTSEVTIIDEQQFHGGEVVLDGKLFVHCTFEDVTFVYHGTAPSDFRDPAFRGKIYLKTDNPIAKTFSAFQNRLRHQPGIVDFRVYIPSPHGDGLIQIE